MNRGFTILEILITIAIVGTLSSYILTSVTESRKKAGYTKTYLEAREILTAINQYILTHGTYPTLQGCLEASNSSHSMYRNISGQTEYQYPVITTVLSPTECLTVAATSSEPTASHVLKVLKDEDLINVDLDVPLGVSVSYGLMTRNPIGSNLFYCGEDLMAVNKPVIMGAIPGEDTRYLPATSKRRKIVNMNTGNTINLPNSFCFYID